jgi:hypothetical protein
MFAVVAKPVLFRVNFVPMIGRLFVAAASVGPQLAP